MYTLNTWKKSYQKQKSLYMNDSEVILGLLKSLCGEVAELRMAVEEKR